jgi:hypothetical protein
MAGAGSPLQLEKSYRVLLRVERLLHPPCPSPSPVKARPLSTPLFVHVQIQDVEEEDEGEAHSPWDPSTKEHPIEEYKKPPLGPMTATERGRQEIDGCKKLLLEIIRRAAFDWVLYRSSRRLLNQQIAAQAYQWLFVERPGTSEWKDRDREHESLTSFESVCACLDLDPNNVRTHLKLLTPKSVVNTGRLAEYRGRDVFALHSNDGATGVPETLTGFTIEGHVADDEMY